MSNERKACFLADRKRLEKIGFRCSVTRSKVIFLLDCEFKTSLLPCGNY